MEHQPPEAEENHERWLVSYADYVTLLFAFFVVMFASSHADKNKAARFSESVKRAYGSERKVAANPKSAGVPVSRDHPLPPNPSELPALGPSLAILMKQLEGEIESGKVRVRMETRGLVISLQETAFFRPGDDRILPEMHAAITRIVESIRQLPNPVRLEGHSDSMPIRTARFPSNWHLSTGRALAMLEFMTLRCDMPAGRLVVAGCGDTDPVDTNDTVEGRARNRRVDIVILSYGAPPEDLPGTLRAKSSDGSPHQTKGTQ